MANLTIIPITLYSFKFNYYWLTLPALEKYL